MSGAVGGMTSESVRSFMEHRAAGGASQNMLSRYRAALGMLYDFLPEDKLLTRERLIEWRAAMNEKGYAYQTVQNYVKWINLYLDFIGLSDIRFNRGCGKDISGARFGYLTAIEPTDKRDRTDVVWLCKCECGNTVEIPATRLIRNNTLSCGCLHRESIKRVNKYFCGTSLEKALNDEVTSKRSMSGYVGVTRKGQRWQAYITYKGRRTFLGTFDNVMEAVRARAAAKEEVMEDAAELLRIYEELHGEDKPLPTKRGEPRQVFPYGERDRKEATVAKRSDNTSGHTGITFRQNRWEARISYNKKRYLLGRFETVADAVRARGAAEALLASDPAAFVKQYSSADRDRRTARE